MAKHQKSEKTPTFNQNERTLKNMILLTNIKHKIIAFVLNVI